MDGQNLFYDSTSFAGEWHIDETMDKLISENYPPAVIVGIDHANEKRINEYNPYDHPEYGEGQGKDFMRWFVDYFIPEIEKSFRIESNKKVRGIGGSSMGGLISLYGISSYPEIFGHAALFSVSFPISPQSLELIDYISEESNIYLAAGEKEPKSLVNQTQEAADELLAYIFPKKNLRLNIIADKGHNEQLWDELFIDYYKWISKKWQKP
jgi:enterochelin esterase-like enzyme